MSEAITKACYDCDGTGRDRHDFTRAKCVECNGTGRVPDVEATLRADVERLVMERTALRAALIVREGLHRTAEMGERLARAERDKVLAENARLTADVERLKGREREAKWLIDPSSLPVFNRKTLREFRRRRDAWLAGCKS